MSSALKVRRWVIRVSVACFPRLGSRLRPPGPGAPLPWGPPAGLGPQRFDRGVAGGGVRRAHMDDAPEPPLACGTARRGKAPTGAGPALERPEAAFHGVGGRGEAGPPHATEALGQLGRHCAAPWE